MTEWQGYKLSERAEAARLGLRPRQPMGSVNPMVSALARVRPSALASPMAMDAQEIYKPYKPLDGVMPDGMAMDSCLPPGAGTVSQWAAGSLFHEGQGFFGYPYLAELSQRAEYRHACEIWAEHAVRKWIKFTGGTDEQRKAIEEDFERLKVRDVIYRWCLHDQYYGRGQIFLNFNDADKLGELAIPLVMASSKISDKRPLQRVTNVEPMWCAPGTYATNNPLQADFYKPMQWFVYGRKVHASRLLTITGKPVSDMLKSSYSFGGLSLIQLMKPYVDNWLRARQSSSDLLNAFSLVVLKTDLSSTMGVNATGEDLFSRLDLMNAIRDNRGSFAIDKDVEELENIAVPLSGVSDLVAQAQEQLASAARIPLSIYLQITPTGLNATSDGETRNFYADVHAYQEKNIRPALQTILEASQLSVLGAIAPEVKFEFEPLWEMSDKDKADIRKSDAEADVAYINAGVISNEEGRERLANDETSLYHGVDLSGPPPEPEPEPGEIADTPK